MTILSFLDFCQKMYMQQPSSLQFSKVLTGFLANHIMLKERFSLDVSQFCCSTWTEEPLPSLCLTPLFKALASFAAANVIDLLTTIKETAVWSFEQCCLWSWNCQRMGGLNRFPDALCSILLSFHFLPKLLSR